MMSDAAAIKQHLHCKPQHAYASSQGTCCDVNCAQCIWFKQECTSLAVPVPNCMVISGVVSALYKWSAASVTLKPAVPKNLQKAALSAVAGQR